MKSIALLSVFVGLMASLSGCGRQLTNDEIIAETRKCEDAGLRARPRYDFNSNLVQIECAPR